ncbi:hypothetical protein JD276_14120 [Leucobacter sp. CSA1]|uniref:Uncharacterized protein n=1 Tax=Leucobacter chromiisoli TaxID=2796471 RepID=A0A934UVQ8_9MICO|nr:hypothetical protein [Leucobacter chromiisoli]MBK0420170.1 hypothetical protein [Leucobacter chromiisoli]
MHTWHASLTFTSAKFSDDAAFDLIGELAPNGASMSIAPDDAGGTITFTVEAPTVLDAVDTAANLLVDRASGTIGAIDLAGVEILSEDAMNELVTDPTYPEVVSFAEIADMGGFSRQRARQLAESGAFPHAVITTAQGPLYSKHAIERYLETRTTKPGRPAKANA